MINFKFFSKILVLLLAFTASSVKAENAELSNYVDTLMTQFLTVVKDPSLSEAAKTKKARSMLLENLDFDWMGKFALGRYRRSLSTQEVSSFIDVYKHYLTNTYSEAVKNYKGEKIKIKAVQKISDQEFVVKTLIIKNSQENLSVDYLVRQQSGGGKTSYKVFDVVTENVSMINSQQAEFGGILGSQGLSKLKEDLLAKSGK